MEKRLWLKINELPDGNVEIVNRNRNNRLDLQQRTKTHRLAVKDVKVVAEVLLKLGQTRSTG